MWEHWVLGEFKIGMLPAALMPALMIMSSWGIYWAMECPEKLLLVDIERILYRTWL